MKIEVLKRSNTKKLVIGLIILILLVISVLFFTSRAKYRSYQIIPFVKGQISVKRNDLTIAALWDGKHQNVFPPKGQGYVYDITKSSCTNDAVITFDEVNWRVNVTSEKPTVCTLTFTYNLNFDLSYDKKITDGNARPRIGEVTVSVTDRNIPTEHKITNYAYKLDSNSWVEDTNSTKAFPNVSWKGYHEITVKAQDKFSLEKTQTIPLYLDTDAPSLELPILTSSKNSNDNTWYKEVTLNMSTIDLDNSIKEFKYCLTTGAECTPDTIIHSEDNIDGVREVSKSLTLTNNSGAQKICMSSIDYVNNATAGGKFCFPQTYKVDNIVPSIGSVVVNTSGKNATVQVQNVVEAHSGIASYHYQLNGGAVTGNGSSINLTNLSDGTYTISVTAKDNAGNVSASVSKEFKIDGTAPTLTASVLSSTAGSNGWYKNLTLQLKAEDASSSIKEFKYCVTTSTDCTPGTIITNVNDVNAARVATLSKALDSSNTGQKVCISATDFVGNTNKVCSTNYLVDGVAPSMGDVTATVSGKNVTASVAGVSDAHSGVASYSWKLNNNAITGSGASLSLTNQPIGNHTISVTVTDNTGNTTTKSTSFRIANTIDDLFAMWGYSNKSTITARTDLGVNRTDKGNKLHKTNDNDGVSYYFVGRPENNWVKLYGKYYQIVRINGSGSIRLIYWGDGSNGWSGSYGWGVWNECTDNECSGLKYTLGIRDGFSSESTAYKKLRNFYNEFFSGTNANVLDVNGKFCNNRNVTEGTGVGSSGSFSAPAEKDNKTFSLICKNVNDTFSYKLANGGNKSMDFPVGYLALEEVLYGGLTEWRDMSSTDNMYISEAWYHLMTPYFRADNLMTVWQVTSTGKLSGLKIGYDAGYRPVINLRSDTTFSKGDGSKSNPFEI